MKEINNIKNSIREYLKNMDELDKNCLNNILDYNKYCNIVLYFKNKYNFDENFCNLINQYNSIIFFYYEN